MRIFELSHGARNFIKNGDKHASSIRLKSRSHRSSHIRTFHHNEKTIQATSQHPATYSTRSFPSNSITFEHIFLSGYCISLNVVHWLNSMKLISKFGFGVLTFLADPFDTVDAFATSTRRPHTTPIYISPLFSKDAFSATSIYLSTGNDPEMSKSDKIPEHSPTASSDKSSVLYRIGSTTSTVVAGTFYAVLTWKRDALMVSFFIGSISNGILSKVLKKILKQERPAGLDESTMEFAPSDNGMPSSHAMSLGFIGTFTALQLPWATVPILVYATISLVYRVKENLHTIEQILVGAVVGSLNGFVWRSFCFGDNPFDIHVINWVSGSLLNEQGLLPWYGLAIPALVGAAVVGSVERRISRFLKSKPE